MDKNIELLTKMIEFDKGDPLRTQHLMKVYEFSHIIGITEGLSEKEQKILDAASILHDIGIIPCERKYGKCNGKMQEEEGPAYARQLLSEVGGFSDEEVERICFLIGHHHTYSQVDAMDYRILIEADFLVNAFEDGTDKEHILKIRDQIFRTETGIRILDTMFDLNASC